jgi:hypothetical protein
MSTEETVSRLRVAKTMLNMQLRSADKRVVRLRPGVAAKNPSPYQTYMLRKVMDYLWLLSGIGKLEQGRSIAKTRENGARRPS